MPASGSSTCTDVDGYQASLRDMFDLLAMQPREFHARLTWLELPRLYLLRAREASPRVAYVTLPPTSVFVTFPAERDASLMHDGVELRFGEITFHGRGDRFHQRTTAPCGWGSVALTPVTLAASARAIVGKDVALPPIRRHLRPLLADFRLLLRLHDEAIRMVTSAPKSVGYPEVVRALEQDLLLALLNCLTPEDKRHHAPVDVRRPSILVQFEAILAANPHRLLRTRDICDALVISERGLRAACTRQLGMGPGRYQRRRRLKLLRGELRHRNAATDVIEIVRRYGFRDVHAFVTEYWNIYGELPSPLTAMTMGR